MIYTELSPTRHSVANLTRICLMKNPHEVLRMKEQEVLRVKNEINALRIAARLLNDETDAAEQTSEHRLMEMPPK
jgi:hypothetical protein